MEPLIEYAFFHTVEGIQSPSSCEFLDGKLVVRFDLPIEHGMQPDLQLLADVLRSEIDLTPSMRQWLANLVEPYGTGEAALMFRKRTKRELTKPLKRKKKFSSDWHIAQFVDDCIYRLREEGKEERTWRQHAIREACKKFNVSDTVVTDAMASWEAAREQVAIIDRENSN